MPRPLSARAEAGTPESPTADRASLRSRLLAACNRLLAGDGPARVRTGTGEWVADQWRPGLPRRDDSVAGTGLTLACRDIRLRVWLEAGAAVQWRGAHHWGLMAPDVQLRFARYRLEGLLDWLEKAVRAPVEIIALDLDGTADDEGAEWIGWQLGRPGMSTATPASAAPSVPSASILATGGGAAASIGRCWLGVEDPDALAMLAPLIERLRESARSTGPRPTSSRRGRSDADGALPLRPIDFRLVLGQTSMAARELAGLGPGDLLRPGPVVPRTPPTSAAGGAGVDRARTTPATGLPLTVNLGRTPLLAAVLEDSGVRFGAPIPLSLPLPGMESPMQTDPRPLELDVTFRFGQLRMTLAQLEAIRPGQFLEMPVAGAEPEVDIVIDGRAAGRGRVVRIGNGWAVAITDWHIAPDAR